MELSMRAAWFLPAALLFTSCQSGSITITGTARPPIAATDVLVYAEPPPRYEVIAVLESVPGKGWSQQAQRDSALEDLKNKAASVGANGVLLTGVMDGGSSSGVGLGVGGGHGGVGVGFSRSSQSLLGKAIFVESSVPDPNVPAN
jgi:hypothetical protein